MKCDERIVEQAVYFVVGRLYNGLLFIVVYMPNPELPSSRWKGLEAG